MKIPFSKITPHPKDYTLVKDRLKLECQMRRLDRSVVSLNGSIKGEVSINCDRCGAEFEREVDWTLELTLSNRAIKDTKDLDIIEFINSDIDLEFILDSEINSYKLLYHYCKSCQDSDDEFVAEF